MRSVFEADGSPTPKLSIKPPAPPDRDAAIDPFFMFIKYGITSVAPLKFDRPANVRFPVTPRVPLNVCDAAAMVPVRVGLALITTLPLPVIALLTKALDPLVNMACDAVAELNTGAAVNVVTPLIAAVPVTLKAVPS
jgi:hypothetical protein